MLDLGARFALRETPNNDTEKERKLFLDPAAETLPLFSELHWVFIPGGPLGTGSSQSGTTHISFGGTCGELGPHHVESKKEKNKNQVKNMKSS